jgi:dihydroxy-acid dehydratase
MPLKGASAPAVSSERSRIAEETGSHAVAVALAKRTPQEILSKESFLNAIIVLQAIGGSTNAIVHLMAIINRHPLLRGKLPWKRLTTSGRVCHYS